MILALILISSILTFFGWCACRVAGGVKADPLDDYEAAQ